MFIYYQNYTNLLEQINDKYIHIEFIDDYILIS